MTLPLTAKQEELWRFIRSCERSPSFEEMKAAIGLKARSGVHRLVTALKERGYADYVPGRSRSIVALDPTPPTPVLPAVAHAKTSELLAELERRGILLACAR